LIVDSPPGAEQPGTLERAILWTVLYADLFDWPLELNEVQRYLPTLATLGEVAALLDGQAPLDGRLARADQLVYLAGRSDLPERRRAARARAARRWPGARRWARWVGAIPFVRFVGVSGGLAIDAAEADDDIDLFLVTAPGRLWLSRLAVVGLVRLARLWGVRLCPNYLITSQALEQPERDYYAAREIAQLVPLYGRGLYHDFRAANPWLALELPNLKLRDPGPEIDRLGSLAPIKVALERLLDSRLGSLLERLERSRKIRKLVARAGRVQGDADLLVFDADHCRGHFEGHGSRIRQRFAERLAEHGIAPTSFGRSAPALRVPVAASESGVASADGQIEGQPGWAARLWRLAPRPRRRARGGAT
jgi:hypothetical protein